MKMSKRARRMGKHNSLANQKASLNLVSLMDIFTILVFFLMLNQSDVDVVQSDKIKLPESYSQKLPEARVIIQVNNEDIIVRGRLVAKVDDVLNNPKERIIPGLKKELAYQTKLKKSLTENEKQNGLSATIMGDIEVPYSLLKKIMLTCTDSEYRNISLATTKKVRPGANVQVSTEGS